MFVYAKQLKKSQLAGILLTVAAVAAVISNNNLRGKNFLAIGTVVNFFSLFKFLVQGQTRSITCTTENT